MFPYLHEDLNLFNTNDDIFTIKEFQEPLITISKTIEKNSRIVKFCKKLEYYFMKLNWKFSKSCLDVPWEFNTISESGNPLVYVKIQGKNPSHTSVILGGVHPNEYTPIYLAYRMIFNLKTEDNLVIAPLVNPDGFFKRIPTRTNLHGVDLNRNFPTLNWDKSRPKAQRYFQGSAPNTEQGTRFQKHLIERFDPKKVISIHAPLGFLDYDGPGDGKGKDSSLEKAKRKAVRRSIKNYRMLRFDVYPGSLGNYAGRERRIPTFTFELPSSQPQKAFAYWKKFQPYMISLLDLDLNKAED